MAFNPANRRYFELHKLEADAFAASNGNIRKLIESREKRFGCIEPTLEEFEHMRLQKSNQKNSDESMENISSVTGKAATTNASEDQRRILEKLKAMREQIGKEHLRIMHKNRGEVLEKTKIELLEVYAMQMAGRITLDNKQINELVTTTSSDDLSDLSNLEEELEETINENYEGQKYDLVNDDSNNFDDASKYTL